MRMSGEESRETGFRLVDLPVAVSLLTRVPVPLDHERAARRVARAAWAFPLVGAGVGVLGGATYWALLTFGVGALAAATLALGAQMLATGALHEDGLADSADGLGAVGRDPEQRRAIMRDSRLGAFGVLALLIAVGARIGALGEMSSGLGAAALVAAGAMSRAGVAIVMAAAPPVESGGLSSRAGRSGADVALVAAAIALLFASAALQLPLDAMRVLPALAAAAMISAGACAWLVRVALRRIGGQTGDVLGAVAVVTEAATLTVLGAMLIP